MLDHISIAVSDINRSRAFYDAVLEPRYATAGQKDDVFSIRGGLNAFVPPQGMHIAFTARSRNAVIGFHETGVALDAQSDGAPELHPMYGDGYFAAFVIDPDGYRLEAVCHESH